MGNNNMHCCGICNQMRTEGILLFGFYICHECEKEIVATNPSDESYQYYVEKLRSINQSSYTI
ncbi:sigma factor G inhibitor Gin [Gracilibacillus salinarum]|uniref:Sigma factor G inhibitor Gin n=1 Tax=Gracilibacillus salinarum TaxID=2932255 RepID=A0ABY4GK32_9BACI|nr:sigma factor G inhibitor Gin [Gracilibacillus salinarum]UOQ83827.1 sigma factor G inhibitor Gin [Gracilibacillus salinarum]